MPSFPTDCVDTMLFNLLCILTVNMTDQECRSGRNKKPTDRYIGWYGFRMLTASRTKQIQSQQLPPLPTVSVADDAVTDVKSDVML